jgi:hemolysin activation/secretion protein
VRIAVASYRLGKVIARGNRYFSDRLLIKEMPLASGESISEADVTSGLALLNLNPYRTVNVVYTPGGAEDSTDVVLETQDRLPLRLSAGYDNAGVSQLGRDRFFAGIDYGNLFGLDQEIGYQLTTNSDVFDGRPDIFGGANRPRFVGHSFNYSAPLPWLDRVELFGVYAQSTPDLPDSYGQTGISAQLSFRYDWRIASSGQWQQQLQFGYDFKRSNNNLEFGGFQVFGSNTHIHQFVIAYDVTKTDTLGQAAANATLVLSPGYFDGDDNDAAFNTSRLGAKARYAYVQSSAQRDVAIGLAFRCMREACSSGRRIRCCPAKNWGLAAIAVCAATSRMLCWATAAGACRRSCARRRSDSARRTRRCNLFCSSMPGTPGTASMSRPSRATVRSSASARACAFRCRDLRPYALPLDFLCAQPCREARQRPWHSCMS